MASLQQSSRRGCSLSRAKGGAKNRHAGVTLIELLVVVAIMALLAGILVPMMRPAFESRGVREASRQLHAFLSKAQALAATRGRPVGVWIEPSENDSKLATQIYLAESPPPYAGDALGDTAKVSGGTVTFSGSFASNLVQTGDHIKFNFQGPRFRITAVTGSSVTIAPSRSAPGPPQDIALPYQIFRRPTRSSINALSLANPTAVDLSGSGIGANGQFGAMNSPLVIAFKPSGGIDRVYVNGNVTQPRSPLFLLIGRRNQEAGSTNLSDLGSLWIAINNQTGFVSTNNNAGGGGVATARELSRKQQNMGGR